jgi:hypothetical protein
LPRTVLDEGAGSSSDGLREADEAVARVHLLNRRKRDCRDCDAFQADLEAREPDPPAADVALVDDLAVCDFDPAVQLVSPRGTCRMKGRSRRAGRFEPMPLSRRLQQLARFRLRRAPAFGRGG